MYNLIEGLWHNIVSLQYQFQELITESVLIDTKENIFVSIYSADNILIEGWLNYYFNMFSLETKPTDFYLHQ